jgi:hypothetical protein
MMREKVKQAQSLQQKIKQVLLKEWDPIGVQAIPEAQDEYDGYVPTIYSMLITRKPINEVFEYLLWLETQHMGLTTDRQLTHNVAERLVNLNDEL